MGRRRKISTDEMLSLVDQYKLDYPDEKITPAKLGFYIRNHGHDIPDHLIRRDDQVIRYIAEKNKGSMDIALQTVSSYRTIDVDQFLMKNRTQAQLKRALMERDSYYSGVASSATKIYKQYKALEEELKKETAFRKKLETDVEELKQKKHKKIDVNTNKTILALRRFIENSVYPEIANEFLREAGLIDFPGNRIRTETVADETVDVDTDVIAKIDDSISAKLMKGFD